MTERDARILLLEAATEYVPDAVFPATVDLLTDPSFTTWPASLDKHHAYRGGLLVHTAEVLDHALWSSATTKADRSVLATAAIWHDSAKMRDYRLLKPGEVQEPDKKFLNTDLGVFVDADFKKLIYHVAGSYANWTATALAAGLAGDDPFKDAVSHCMLAHHGSRGWNSPVEPQTVEALLLSQADLLSALYGAARYSPHEVI